MHLVLERLPATFELAGAGLLLALCLAIPAGIISAVKRNTPIDYVSTVVALMGQAMPTFWLGIMLILVFSVRLSWLPSSGRGDLQHLDPAGGDARALHDGAHHAAHALRHARGARAGLHPHRARQGSQRAARGLEARAQERVDPHRHHRRASSSARCSAARSSPRRSSPGPASAASRCRPSSTATTRWCRPPSSSSPAPSSS